MDTSGLEDTLRDVLVVSRNAAIAAALSADDLNVIPVDPDETPGWPEFAGAPHLLVLELGDAEMMVDVVRDLRRADISVSVLIIAESVSDSPRLIALRLADDNVKTLSLPVTQNRLLRAVSRTLLARAAADAREEETYRALAADDADDDSWMPSVGVDWGSEDLESAEPVLPIDTSAPATRPVVPAVPSVSPGPDGEAAAATDAAAGPSADMPAQTPPPTPAQPAPTQPTPAQPAPTQPAGAAERDPLTDPDWTVDSPDDWMAAYTWDSIAASTGIEEVARDFPTWSSIEAEASAGPAPGAAADSTPAPSSPGTPEAHPAAEPIARPEPLAADAPAADEPPAADWPAEPAAALDSRAFDIEFGSSEVQWPSFDPGSFSDEPQARSAEPGATASKRGPRAGDAPSLADYPAYPGAGGTAAAARPETAAPEAATATNADPDGAVGDGLDLPPAPDTEPRKRRLAPWARPRQRPHGSAPAGPAAPASATAASSPTPSLPAATRPEVPATRPAEPLTPVARAAEPATAPSRQSAPMAPAARSADPQPLAPEARAPQARAPQQGPAGHPGYPAAPPIPPAGRHAAGRPEGTESAGDGNAREGTVARPRMRSRSEAKAEAKARAEVEKRRAAAERAAAKAARARADAEAKAAAKAAKAARAKAAEDAKQARARAAEAAKVRAAQQARTDAATQHDVRARASNAAAQAHARAAEQDARVDAPASPVAPTPAPPQPSAAPPPAGTTPPAATTAPAARQAGEPSGEETAAEQRRRRKAAQEADKAARARAEAEARAAERAAADAAKAAKARAEDDAKQAIEIAKQAAAEAKRRAKADAEAAKLAEKATAARAKTSQTRAGADAKAAAEAAKAIEKARAEAARIADSHARAEEKAAKARALADAKAAREAAKAAEKAALDSSRAQERARVVSERAAHAQAKVDARLAAEAAKAAKVKAQMDAHQAAVRAREEAERARIEAKLEAETARRQTIARVENLIQETKIKAEADRIVNEAVRKAEEDFEARALANRPVYYGPELEPPGIGYLHQLMAMTDTLAAPSQVAEEIAFVAMEHLECEAVAIMIPDGDAWATASGIGIARHDIRFRLGEEHWFIREVLGREAVAVVDDPKAFADELTGVPLAGWPHLVGIPMPRANSILVAARTDSPFEDQVLEVFAEGIDDYVTELAETLETRDVAREIHARRRRR